MNASLSANFDFFSKKDSETLGSKMRIKAGKTKNNKAKETNNP